MSHGIELEHTDSVKQKVLGTTHERALDLLVDLVRSREAYRDELIKQNGQYTKLEKELERAREECHRVIKQRDEHGDEIDHMAAVIEWLRGLLVEAGIGFDGRELSAGKRAKMLRASVAGKPYDTSSDPEDLDDAIERWEIRVAKALGIERSRHGVDE